MRWVLPFENTALTGYTLAWLDGATAPRKQIDGLVDHGSHDCNISGGYL